MLTTIPVCPTCSCPDTERETHDRWQCRRCGWRFTFDPDTGTALDWFTWLPTDRPEPQKVLPGG